jgi:hypothetical protein
MNTLLRINDGPDLPGVNSVSDPEWWTEYGQRFTHTDDRVNDPPSQPELVAASGEVIAF